MEARIYCKRSRRKEKKKKKDKRIGKGRTDGRNLSSGEAE